MLIVSRKINETIEIRPHDDAGHATLAEVFSGGPIQISLIRVGTGRVKVAIDAPRELKIWRCANKSASSDGVNSAEG